MKSTSIHHPIKDFGPMINAYVEMQMNYLSQNYFHPSTIELDLIKKNGEYTANLVFSCQEFSFSVSNRSWSPYKAVENVTLLARDEIMQRTYNACAYS